MSRQGAWGRASTIHRPHRVNRHTDRVALAATQTPGPRGSSRFDPSRVPVMWRDGFGPALERVVQALGDFKEGVVWRPGQTSVRRHPATRIGAVHLIVFR